MNPLSRIGSNQELRQVCSHGSTWLKGSGSGKETKILSAEPLPLPCPWLSTIFETSIASTAFSTIVFSLSLTLLLGSSSMLLLLQCLNRSPNNNPRPHHHPWSTMSSPSSPPSPIPGELSNLLNEFVVIDTRKWMTCICPFLVDVNRWDSEGPFKPLHVMNPTRLAFIRSALCRHFK